MDSPSSLSEGFAEIVREMQKGESLSRHFVCPPWQVETETQQVAFPGTMESGLEGERIAYGVFSVPDAEVIFRQNAERIVAMRMQVRGELLGIIGMKPRTRQPHELWEMHALQDGGVKFGGRSTIQTIEDGGNSVVVRCGAKWDKDGIMAERSGRISIPDFPLFDSMESAQELATNRTTDRPVALRSTHQQSPLYREIPHGAQLMVYPGDQRKGTEHFVVAASPTKTHTIFENLPRVATPELLRDAMLGRVKALEKWLEGKKAAA